MRRLFSLLAVLLAISACSTVPPESDTDKRSGVAVRRFGGGDEVVLFSLGLLETRYRFGGRNPEAGFDCSGMVSYVYEKATGVRLSGSAADIAKRGRVIARSELRPGDLVFFNTLGRARSHVGIYLGEGKFIHAPSSKGEARVRTDSLDDGYFASRFEEARSYFD